MDDSKKPSSQGSREVQVDLGDDLLVDTSFIPRPSPMGVNDWMQSADILLREGFSPDAKKLLHQVLIHQPGNSRARVLLEEIQKAEIQGMLEPQKLGKSAKNRQETLHEDEDPDLVLKKLDHELQLGLFSSTADSRTLSPRLGDVWAPEISEQLIHEVDQKYFDASTQDWIDLGIAFLEMELSSVATHLFTRASQRLNSSSSDTPLLSRSVICLLALSLLHQGKPFEAFIQLQPLVRDFEIQNADKLELFYLMGRAYDLMGKSEMAFEFYLQVFNIDPHYRDIEKQLRKKSKPLV